MPTRVDLAKIHIAKKELGIGEKAYRNLLCRRYEQVSAANLSHQEAVDLIDYFRRLGWQPRPGRTPRRSASLAQRRMILALWDELAAKGELRHPEGSSLDHFIANITGKGGIRDLQVRDAIRVIEALKKWVGRKSEN